jgi:hypothetical protein
MEMVLMKTHIDLRVICSKTMMASSTKRSVIVFMDFIEILKRIAFNEPHH